MSFIKELKRRNVVKVGIAYIVVAWILIEITATTFPILKLPDWSVTLVTLLLLIGLPLALIFAWAFELTPEGIKLDKDVVRSEPSTYPNARKLDFFIIAALALALVFVVIDQYVLEEKAAQSAKSEFAGRPATADARLAEWGQSIAVLPFRNRSALADDVYFVDRYPR